jgi:hypothetical protein
MTCYAGVAWLRGGIIRKDCTRTEDEQATQRLGPLGLNLCEIFGGKIAKQVAGTSCRLRRVRKWSLWRGRPPPKRKKMLHTEYGEPVM